jgi:DNA-binding HxlR family transcriptional regulator
MKTYQIKFRVATRVLTSLLERIGEVGPVVIEVVDETPPVVTYSDIPGVQAYNGYADKSIPTPRMLYGTGKQAILDRLKDGPVPYHALADTYTNAGLKKSGLGAALGKMRAARLIEKTSAGWWILTEKKEV